MKIKLDLICSLLIATVLFGCSNKSITNISDDIRQVDLLNKNKQVVKTYYQSFNRKVYDWFEVSCDFININKKFKIIQGCELTELSKSFIKKQSKEDSLVNSNDNIASNKSISSNERNSNSNGNNNQVASNNPPNPPSNNPIANPNPPSNAANDPWHN